MTSAFNHPWIMTFSPRVVSFQREQPWYRTDCAGNGHKNTPTRCCLHAIRKHQCVARQSSKCQNECALHSFDLACLATHQKMLTLGRQDMRVVGFSTKDMMQLILIALCPLWQSPSPCRLRGNVATRAPYLVLIVRGYECKRGARNQSGCGGCPLACLALAFACALLGVVLCYVDQYCMSVGGTV